MDTTQARQRLDAERTRLLGVKGAADRLYVGAHPAEQGELSVDKSQADQGTESADREVELGVTHRVDSELDEVQAAIERLEAGAYGACELCGQPIGEGRLEVMPAARYCIEDQAKAESDPTLRVSV